MLNALFFLVVAAGSPAAAPQKNAGPPFPEVATLKERVATLEQENSQLKSRIIELLSAAAVVPKGPSPDEKAFNEAVTALRSLKVATQGSIIDFRRYFLDAAAKVEAVPASHPRRETLRSAVSVYSDANTLLGLGVKGKASVLDEQTWKAMRAKYSSENIYPGCNGIRVFGTESAVSETFTSCGLALCALAESQLGNALQRPLPAPPATTPTPLPADPWSTSAPAPPVPPASGVGDVPTSRLFDALAAIGSTQLTGRGAVLTLPSASLFGVNSTVLTQSGQSLLYRLAEVLKAAVGVYARVEGYTDSGGKAEVNLKLSESRAKVVRDFLTSRGVGEERVAFQGYGAANPVAENATADGRVRNRRIEVVAAEGQIAEPDLLK